MGEFATSTYRLTYPAYFGQFSANMEFFLKANITIQFLHKLTVFCVKNADIYS
jgi:hypothetical protein